MNFQENLPNSISFHTDATQTT